MDPITGIIMAVILWGISLTIAIVRWPFVLLKETAAAHPKRTARMVLGALAAGLFAYLFDLPYVIELSLGGGVLSLIAGELIT